MSLLSLLSLLYLSYSRCRPTMVIEARFSFGVFGWYPYSSWWPDPLIHNEILLTYRQAPNHLRFYSRMFVPLECQLTTIISMSFWIAWTWIVTLFILKVQMTVVALWYQQGFLSSAIRSALLDLKVLLVMVFSLKASWSRLVYSPHYLPFFLTHWHIDFLRFCFNQVDFHVC